MFITLENIQAHGKHMNAMGHKSNLNLLAGKQIVFYYLTRDETGITGVRQIGGFIYHMLESQPAYAVMKLALPLRDDDTQIFVVLPAERYQLMTLDPPNAEMTVCMLVEAPELHAELERAWRRDQAKKKQHLKPVPLH